LPRLLRLDGSQANYTLTFVAGQLPEPKRTAQQQRLLDQNVQEARRAAE